MISNGKRLAVALSCAALFAGQRWAGACAFCPMTYERSGDLGRACVSSLEPGARHATAAVR
eukprot:scaffold314557_cov36-Tisochrysis_lutea.AAC.2